MKKIVRTTYTIALYSFALIGFILVAGYGAVRAGLTNTRGVIDEQTAYFRQHETRATEPSWTETEEWETLREALKKDAAVIDRAAHDAGVPARSIVAQAVVEQLRLFFSQRQIFKEIFSPLKVLGSQSQFSWGILGIKESAAIDVEDHLKNPRSSFYPGTGYEHLLDFKTDNPARERFERIVNSKDHYYAYLYAGLYLKQIEVQWEKAGFDISNRPEILGTLYNIGFPHSKPNPDPKVGGAEIDIGNDVYSFGRIAYDFYYSDELTDYFPR